MSRVLLSVGLAGILAAAAAAPAAAEDPLARAWAAAGLDRAGSIGERQAARLNVIGYHAAVAALCDGFELDEAEVAREAADLLDEAHAGSSGAERLQLQVDAMIALGTAKGLFLAEGALDPKAFCAGAARTRDLPEFDDLWADR